MKIIIPFESGNVEAFLPEGFDVLSMPKVPALKNLTMAISSSLNNPIGSRPLLEIAKEKKKSDLKATACIVVSDKTRPVPYKGQRGILMPLLSLLFSAGYSAGEILILVANGMHEPMTQPELMFMLGPEPFKLGIKVENHDATDELMLGSAGTTARGTHALIDKRYLSADLKILTGLVESHFMAGVSGGRKSVCPGLLGEESTLIFHGPEFMAHPKSRDLVLDGNPVHEEALEVAKLAGVDFIVNVTVNSKFEPTGIFCGDLETAHIAAAEHLKDEVGIPIEKPYDLIITHGGFVARNHYQAAKAAVASLGALKDSNSSLVIIADNRDVEPIGSEGYRATLALLRKIGPKAFEQVLGSPDWKFIIDQWEAQQWSKVLAKVSAEDLVYFAPQLSYGDRRILPGFDGRSLLGQGIRSDGSEVPAFLKAAISRYLKSRGYTKSDLTSGRCCAAFLADGPYGIPLRLSSAH